MFIANKKRRRVAKLCFHGKNSGSVFLAFSLTPTQYPNLIELIRIKASEFYFFFFVCQVSNFHGTGGLDCFFHSFLILQSLNAK